jgi:predicted  nucleic acid-binding Zn-ribbon protein
VDAAPDTRRQLGQIMVDEGFLTEDQLLDALAEQNRSGTPLGKVLVDLGFVSPGAVANALAEQHGGLLRTEYGTSAGLREMAGRAPIRTEAPQPTLPTPAAASPQTPPAAPLGSGLRLAGAATEAPAAEAPAPVDAPAQQQPEPEPALAPAPEPAAAPEPEPEPPAARESTARIEELESQLHAVLTERNSLAQSFNELKARLSDAAQAHKAGVKAEVEERIGGLESQLQAAAANREELERAQQHAAERIAELEGRLAETAENRHELDSELQTLRTIAAGRDAALERAAGLEAELEQLRARDNEDSSAELQELAQLRDAAEAHARALEHDLAQLREQTESEAARASALAAELAELREQSSGRDEGLAAHVSGLEESLRVLTAERDSAVARAAELEPEVVTLRGQLRDASPPVEGSQADVSELRRQLAARERRLAESVGEIAKMNREHRALLQLVERQFQLEETTTSVPEPRGEAAHVLFVPAVTGYTLVERDGIAPEAGDIIEVDGGRYVVRRHGPSPLPGPRRRCAYLERA